MKTSSDRSNTLIWQNSTKCLLPSVCVCSDLYPSRWHARIRMTLTWLFQMLPYNPACPYWPSLQDSSKHWWFGDRWNDKGKAPKWTPQADAATEGLCATRHQGTMFGNWSVTTCNSVHVANTLLAELRSLRSVWCSAPQSDIKFLHLLQEITDLGRGQREQTMLIKLIIIIIKKNL